MTLLIPHRLPGPGIAATVLERTNRFLARCRLEDGLEADAHVPDRGRLVGIVEPGARCRLYAAPEGSRRTPYSLLVCEERATSTLVAIDPAGANLRVKALLERGLVPGIAPGVAFRPEFRLGSSRFDFRIEPPDGPVLLEVKSVGAAAHGTGLFPDAPTERGSRHLVELAEHARTRAYRAMVLFVAQRGDVERVRANAAIDPGFAETMKRTRPWIDFRAIGFEVRPEGCLLRGALPVE